jgi:hypothetical protein
MLTNDMATNLAAVLNRVRYAVRVTRCDHGDPAQVEARMTVYFSASTAINDAAQSFFALWPGFQLTTLPSVLASTSTGKDPNDMEVNVAAIFSSNDTGSRSTSVITPHATRSAALPTTQPNSPVAGTKPFTVSATAVAVTNDSGSLVVRSAPTATLPGTAATEACSSEILGRINCKVDRGPECCMVPDDEQVHLIEEFVSYSQGVVP